MFLCQRLRESPCATSGRWPRSHTSLLTVLFPFSSPGTLPQGICLCPTKPKPPRNNGCDGMGLRFSFTCLFFMSYTDQKQEAGEAAKEFPCCPVAFRSWLFWGQGNQLEFNLRIVSSLQEQGKERAAFCFASFGFMKVLALFPLKKKCMDLCAFCYARGHK